ncbi:MAG: type II toxin-antitoxin system RelE/ParE family toxin [Kiloniellales bacterium]
MRLRWRLSAVSDLARIRDYIAERNPASAGMVVDRIYRAVSRLEYFPDSGRLGTVPNTREVVAPGLPYIVVYQHGDNAIEVIAIFHAAQDRP